MRKRNWIIAAVLLSFAPPAFADVGLFSDRPVKVGEQQGLPDQDEHTDGGAGGCAILDARKSASVSGGVYKSRRRRSDSSVGTLTE